MLCFIAVLAIYSPLSSQNIPYFRSAVDVCEAVATKADDHGLDDVLAVAVASEESRFRRDVESPSGAIGPLQIMPEYWCPRSGPCDSIEAGVKALKYYLTKYEGNEARALRAYAGSGPRARAYSNRVRLKLKHLRNALEAL